METKQKFEFRSDQQTTRIVNAKIKQIIVLFYDYLCEWARIWTNISLDSVISYSANGKDGNNLCHKIIFLSTKFVLSRLLDIGLILFGMFIDLKYISDHEHEKKKLANIYLYVYSQNLCMLI